MERGPRYFAKYKNKIENRLPAATWMDLEIIILSEVSQREKDKNHMIYHLCVESNKMTQMNLFTKQKQTHRHRKLTCGYQRGN